MELQIFISSIIIIINLDGILYLLDIISYLDHPAISVVLVITFTTEIILNVKDAIRLSNAKH